jgi:prevent-host-death family protein
MAKVEHMSVAEFKRRFADVVGKVRHGDTRIVVERRGSPVLGLVPPEEVEAHAGRALLEFGRSLGEEAEGFAQEMERIVAERHERMPREPRGWYGDPADDDKPVEP